MHLISRHFIVACLGCAITAFAHEAGINGEDHANTSVLRSIRVSFDEHGKVNPWNHLDFHNDPNAFQFAIVSDRTGSARPGVFEDAIAKLNLLQPEFVMSVGDMIEGYSYDKTVVNAQWDEFQGFIKKLAEAGVQVVVCQGSMSELAVHFFEKYSMMAIKIMSKWELKRIGRACGATPIVKLECPTPDEMGYCDEVTF